VGIVGAGPAGLVLAQLLQQRGVESVVIEARDRDYVQQRVRAGVLEQGTVDLLTEMGLGERLHREGIVHEGLELRFGGALSPLVVGYAVGWWNSWTVPFYITAGIYVFGAICTLLVDPRKRVMQPL